MNLSTSIDEGYRELIERAEEYIQAQRDELATSGHLYSLHFSTLDEWLRDLKLIRKRETIEQSRRCA